MANPPSDDNANAGGDIGGDVVAPTEGQLATELLVAAAQALGPGEHWRLVRVLQPNATRWHKATDDLYGSQTYGTPDNLTEDWTIPWNLESIPQEFLFAQRYDHYYPTPLYL